MIGGWEEGVIQIWDAETGKSVNTVENPKDPVSMLVYRVNPDRLKLITCHMQKIF